MIVEDLFEPSDQFLDVAFPLTGDAADAGEGAGNRPLMLEHIAIVVLDQVAMARVT